MYFKYEVLQIQCLSNLMCSKSTYELTFIFSIKSIDITYSFSEMLIDCLKSATFYNLVYDQHDDKNWYFENNKKVKKNIPIKHWLYLRFLNSLWFLR